MSDFRAIAVVTAALKQLLLPVVKNAVSGSDVQFNRPDPANVSTPLVNVFLYQITPNAAYRNADLPTRRSDGSLAQRPQAAFDLHYMFTFHGDETKLEPQRMLGAVVTALHAQPLLTSDNITSGEGSLANNILIGCGLENQIERVKFTPTALSLEEFSKLWSVFFQVEYNLSAVYQASVVLMQTSDTPQEAPPVVARNFYVIPFQSPYISQVISQAGAQVPITSSSTLLIQGQQLRAPNTFALLEDQDFPPVTMTDTQITLPVPSQIHAGVQALQVLQKIPMGLGSPPPLHRGLESNVAPFVLRPTITTVTPPLPGGTNVLLSLTPNIGVGQRAVLVLNNVSVSPGTAFVSPPVVATADSGTITINISGVPHGTYLVRVQIDGAESLLTVDPVTNKFTGPTVVMP